MDKIFPWEPMLETGIDVVDRQHMEFLKHLNLFILRVKGGQESSAQAALAELDYLRYYIQLHFSTEEGYMVQSNDRQYREHQAEHKHLAFQVKALSSKIHEDSSQEEIQELFELLNQWVKDHILTWDLQFSVRYRTWAEERKKQG